MNHATSYQTCVPRDEPDTSERDGRVFAALVDALELTIEDGEDETVADVTDATRVPAGNWAGASMRPDPRWDRTEYRELLPEALEALAARMRK